VHVRAGCALDVDVLEAQREPSADVDEGRPPGRGVADPFEPAGGDLGGRGGLEPPSSDEPPSSAGPPSSAEPPSSAVPPSSAWPPPPAGPSPAGAAPPAGTGALASSGSSRVRCEKDGPMRTTTATATTSAEATVPARGRPVSRVTTIEASRVATTIPATSSHARGLRALFSITPGRSR
jgi:hypothetical protein